MIDEDGDEYEDIRKIKYTGICIIKKGFIERPMKIYEGNGKMLYCCFCDGYKTDCVDRPREEVSNRKS